MRLKKNQKVIDYDDVDVISIIAGQYIFIEEFFNSDIVENIMYIYNDFHYVTFIIENDFETFATYYFKCLDRIKRNKEDDDKNKVFKIWLLQVQNGNKESFDDFYEKAKVKSETNNMSEKEKTKEEEEIIKRIEKYQNKDIKFRRKKL